MTILIVDDDHNMVGMLQRWIEPLGVDIRVARGVEEAISQMTFNPHPDLVLLDLVLPPHSARDTISAIKKLREFNPSLTVIIVSGMDKETILGLVKEVKEVKIEGIIEKGNGFNQTSLLEAMQTAISNAPNLSDLYLSIGEKIQELTKKETQRIKL